MDKNQKINCTVKSCKFNKKEEQQCSLEQIKITPTQNCKTKETDESMCSSYQYNK